MEDDIDYYHIALLNALRQHRNRFSQKRPSLSYVDEHPREHDQGRFSESPRLRNDRELFEAGFLIILLRDDINDADIQLLPQKKARELMGKLHDFFGLLEEVANNDLELTTSPAVTSQGDFEPNGLYPRLETIVSLLGRSDGPFSLTSSSSSSSSSIFKVDTLANGIAARSVVQELNHILDGAEFTLSSRLLPTAADNAIPTIGSVDDWVRTFDREYREAAGRILDTINSELMDCGSAGCGSPHQVIVQLAGVSIPDPPNSEMRLDTCIYCPRPKRWQNTRCVLGNGNTRSGSVHKKSLCDFAKSSLISGQNALGLLFDRRYSALSLHSDISGLPTTDPNRYPMRTLKDLIDKQNAFNPQPSRSEQEDPFKHPERRTLAAKLALNFLSFYAWRHTARPWNSNGIYFLSSSRRDYDRGLPYISCHVGADSTTELNIADDTAPIQYFTEFARLLLEIEFGPFLKDNFSADDEWGWFPIREFHEDMHNYRDLSKEKYLEAVEACLQFHKLFKTARATSLGRLEAPTDTYRKLIRTKIVCKIVEDLPGFRQQPARRTRHEAEMVPDSDSDSDDYQRHATPCSVYPRLRHEFGRADYVQSVVTESGRARRKLAFSASEFEEQELAAYDGGLDHSQILRKMKGLKVSFHQDLTLNLGCLFDTQSDRQRPETASSAQKWLDTLENDVHPTISSLRRTKDRMVRVAVLDTGLDIMHPRIQTHLRRNGSCIRECQDWTESPYGITDCVGHGTAVCDVLLRAAKVELFVGKVSDNAEFDSAAPARVATALQHATSAEGWNVDIVVLSLGFEQEDDLLCRSVEDAFIRKKIILAAASNSGSIVPEKRVSYPARIQGQVLSIRSATGQSEKAPASPKGSLGDDNFMILGEGIEAAWPPGLNEGHATRYVSGSSFATPLAAGVASLILEFSIQRHKKGFNVPEESADILWTYRGIRRIFRYMSGVDDQNSHSDCSMISPWKLFDRNRDYDACGLEIKRLMKGV